MSNPLSLVDYNFLLDFIITTFFSTLSISARCFTHIDGLGGIFHSHRTLYTYTSFCSVTSLFSSTHGRGWWGGSGVMGYVRIRASMHILTKTSIVNYHKHS
ncbi:hypothetical protein BDV39DRAFT_88521 [Aspergillus sergii]|uniref:Uncharacterized protein n=1 Tax=Aspergillus sergii TaxID=1034303 RepID=A0A5N6X051_9EURO|nr:hypothetical protein BDV39DRAFT_88521 [Aspergillus sergii]